MQPAVAAPIKDKNLDLDVRRANLLAIKAQLDADMAEIRARNRATLEAFESWSHDNALREFARKRGADMTKVDAALRARRERTHAENMDKVMNA